MLNVGANNSPTYSSMKNIGLLNTETKTTNLDSYIGGLLANSEPPPPYKGYKLYSHLEHNSVKINGDKNSQNEI